MNKFTFALLLLALFGCQKDEPKYYYKGQQVEPALEWCSSDGKNCFMSVDPVIDGQAVEEKRLVVPKSEVVKK